MNCDSLNLLFLGKNDLTAQQRFEKMIFEESLIFKGKLNSDEYKKKIKVIIISIF
jgi:hypothetical protein